jgi:hypothetical protein
MSRQPTHHGYAVNVKSHGRYDYSDALTWEEAEAVWSWEAERFWDEAEEIAREHGFRGVYSEGRSGGWCVPQPQPSPDSIGHGIEYVPGSEWTAWLKRFRAFEADILALLAEAESDAAEALREAGRKAEAEPAERAYWEARDVITL